MIRIALAIVAFSVSTAAFAHAPADVAITPKAPVISTACPADVDVLRGIADLPVQHRVAATTAFA